MLISFIFSYSETFFVVFYLSFYFVLGQGPNKFHQELLHRFRSFSLELIVPLTINFRVWFQLDLGRTEFPTIRRVVVGNSTKQLLIGFNKSVLELGYLWVFLGSPLAGVLKLPLSTVYASCGSTSDISSSDVPCSLTWASFLTDNFGTFRATGRNLWNLSPPLGKPHVGGSDPVVPWYWSATRSITLATNTSFSNFPVTNYRTSHQWGEMAWARPFQAATR